MPHATVRVRELQNANLAAAVGNIGPLPAGFLGMLQNHIAANNHTGTGCIVTNANKQVVGNTATLGIDYTGSMTADDLKQIVRMP